jgi:hypothetical protein
MPTIPRFPIRPVRLQLRSLLIAVACLLAAQLVGAGCGDRAEAKESAAVRAAFEAYRKALLARDGEAASALVDRETIEHSVALAPTRRRRC